MDLKLGRVGSPQMIEMMVELVWQDEKLASASFTRIQFCTESLEECLVDLKDANRADLQELRYQLEGLPDSKVSELMELEKLGLQL